MLKILWIMVRWAIQAFLLACSVLSKRKIEQSWADGECRDRLGLSMTLNGQFQPRSMPAQFAYIYTVSFAQKKTYTLFQPGSQPISRSAPEWIFNEARWSCMDFIACWHKTLKKRSSCDLVSSWSDQPSDFFFMSCLWMLMSSRISCQSTYFFSLSGD